MYRSERIRELREARALTQTVLAKLANTTQPTMSRIEKGEIKDRPDRALAVRLARVLGVELADVFEDAVDEGAAEALEDRSSGVTFESSAFEAAVLRVVDPKVHTINDLRAAVEAYAAATRASGVTRNPEDVARVWLEAARALRAENIAATPAAVVARVAMREIA
jgi:transcriptional regulator with XRE-family HTH domain